MLSLNDREWKEFRVEEIFHDIQISSSNDLGKLKKGKVPCIGRTQLNNGFAGEYDVENDKINKGNCITISMVGEPRSFYQKNDFGCSQNILILRNKVFNSYVYKFLCCELNQQLLKYNYGYPVGKDRFIRQFIKLPTIFNNKPDYEFMEHFIKEREQIKRKKYIDYCKKQLNKLGKAVDIEPLKNKEWNSFFITDIFDEIARGKRLKKEDHISGNKPYVSSTSMNNGVDQFIGNDNKIRVYSKCLSLANSGSVGSCFYEPFEFIASDHVTHLKNKNMSPYTYLFISSMLSRLSEKYNFNREINDNRIKREKVFLPCLSDGKPDYVYMEQYTKNIMIKKYNEYLDYINN